MAEQHRILIWVDVESSFGRGIAQGIARYSNLFANWTYDIEPPLYSQNRDWDRITPEMIKSRNVDALIIAANKHFDEIVKLNLPIVITHYRGSTPPPQTVTSLAIDEVAIGHMAAEHLLKCGLRNFACCGFTDTPWRETRGRYFNEKIAEKGYETHFCKRLFRTRRSEKYQTAFAQWLKSLPKPIGVFVYDDDCGRYVLEVCKNFDMSVPHEVAVISVDNDEIPCMMSSPPLSSIALNSELAGYGIAKELARHFNGEKVEQARIGVHPTHVEVRQSSDVLAVEDRYVSKALHYIRSNSHRAIQATDVSEGISISRSALYQRFREALNCTIYDEIKRARIERISRMLRETDEQISRIALSLEFSSIEHLSRFFRYETGMTPTDYRAKYSNK